MSVLKKSEYDTIRAQDLKIAADHKGVMIELIIDGKVLQKHLKTIGKSTQWLQKQLSIRNINRVSDVIFAGYFSNGELYVSLRNQTSMSTHSQFMSSI